MSNSTNYVKYKKNSVLKKIIIIIAAIIVVILMLGIKNATRIEHSMFVTAIGIDKSPDDPNKVLVTFQIVPPQVTSQSSTDIDKVIVTSINEDSLEKAVAMVHNYMSAVVNLSHTRAVVFSEDIAKDGILKYLTSISSNKMYDTNMYVLVCRGSAQTYLESISQDTEVNPLLYYNIIRNSQYISSSSKTVTVMQFLKQLYDPNVQPTAPVCNIVDNASASNNSSDESKSKNEQSGIQSQNQENSKKPTTAEPTNPEESGEKQQQSSDSSSSKSEEGKDDKSSAAGKIDNTESSNENVIKQKSNIKIEIGGMAVFDNDKLVGFLNNDETAYHLMLNSKITNYYINIAHSGENNKEVETNVYLWQQKNSTIKVNLKGDTPLIDITIPLNANILDTESKTFNFYDTEYMNKMKNLIIEKLEKSMNSYINKMQKEYKVDIDDYIEYSKKSFLTTTEMNDYDWNKRFLNAKIKVNFDIRFVVSGLSTMK